MTIRQIWESTMAGQFMADCPPDQDVPVAEKIGLGLTVPLVTLAVFLVACLGLAVIVAT